MLGLWLFLAILAIAVHYNEGVRCYGKVAAGYVEAHGHYVTVARHYSNVALHVEEP